MRTRVLPASLLALGVLLASGSRPARADESEYAKRLEEKAAPIVAVKLVVKAGERERSLTEPGVIVDPAGVVMLRAQAVRGTDFRGQKMTVTNLRVVFPGEEKEYDAVVGATDTRLGLGFVRIRDLAGKAVTAVDLSSPAEPKLGDELFGVIRLEQGFDYAPLFGTARVAGQVVKPRAMWIVTGFLPAHHFLYAPDGRPAGVVIQQRGVAEGEDGGGSRTFLLPMKTAIATIQQGVKASQTALDELVAREKAAAAEASAEGPAATPAPAAPSPGAPPDPATPDTPK